LKWYKHLTASGTDPDIGELIDELGFKGYYLFFRTLEIMSIEYNISNPGQNLFNFDWFLNQFSRKINQKTLLKFLQITNKTGRILYQLNGKDIHLNCPKLKHLTDEYTRQKPYRDSDKVTEKVTGKVTPLVTERVTPKIKDIRIKNKEKNKEDTHKEIRAEIISYLNEKTGKSFDPDSKDAIEYINGRLNDKKNPANITDLKRIVDIKVTQWLGDPEKDQYLRPSTLFRPSNFENYRNERHISPKKDAVGQPKPKQKTDKEKEFDATYLAKRKELEDQFKDQIEAAKKKKDSYLLDEIECAIKEELTEWTENRL